MKRRFTILTAALALLVSLAFPMGMWGQTRESYNVTYDYSDLGDMLYGSYLDASSYWKVPESSGNNALISIPITYQPESNITVTFRIATFGNGNNPSASNTTITAVGKESNSNWTGTGVSSYPSSSSYVNGIMTITKPQNPTTLGELDITMGVNTGVKIFRLQSITVSYTYSGGTPTTYTVTFNAGAGTFVGSTDFPNASNTMAAGTYTLPSATPATGYTFDGWTATGINTPITGSYTVSGNVDFTAHYTENSTPTPGGETLTFDFEEETAHRTSGNNSYTSTNTYSENGATITLTYADAVTTGTPLNGTANVLGRIAKNTTNSPIIHIGEINITDKTITSIAYKTKGVATMSQVLEYSLNNSNWTNILSLSSMPTSVTTETAANLSITGTSLYLRWTTSVSASNNSPRDFQLDDIVITYTTSGTPVVETPIIYPNGGEFYPTTQSISISCATQDATIRYTLDGNDPTTSSEVYSEPFTLTATTTVKAKAFKDGMDPSEIASATFTKATVMTVAQAIAATPTTGESGFVYVHGIVSEIVEEYNSQYHNISYNISDDGTTTSAQLEAFRGKNLNNTNFTSNQDILPGDIVTIYGKLTLYDGETYELAAGNYIVEYTPHTAVQYDLTVSSLSTNVNAIYLFNVEDETNPLITDGHAGTVQVYDGTSIIVSPDIADGYVLETLIVDDNNVTSQVAGGAYTFTMPTHAVTISATAKVAPTPVTYTLATSIISGKTYIIVNNEYSKAMGTQNSNNRAAVDVVINNNKITVSSSDVYEFVISTDETNSGLFNIYDGANNGYLYAAGGSGSSANNHLKTQATLTDNGRWTISFNEGKAIITAQGDAARNIIRYNNNNDIFSCYASGQKDVHLYVKDEAPVTETHKLTIPAFNSQDGGYRLISSPVATATNPTNPENVTNMITDDDDNNNRTYDLYRFDQAEELEWRNYRNPNGGGFSLEFGKGYLYGNLSDVELVFTGTAITSGTQNVTLDYTEGAEFAGWNLVGNPFGVEAYIDRPFYRMNTSGQINGTTETGSIGVMEGVFVIATNEEQMPFSTQPIVKKGSTLALNLNSSHTVLDRAIVRFDEGQQLPKFQLNKNHTKVYFTMDGKDYAIVRSEEMGAMPVNFKAEDNGTYSLNFNSENVEFSYLHLIDNMTGKDVDLLQTPSYSFEAKTTDYESRFKLVFATGDNSNDDNFAFYSNGSFVINNPSTGSGPAELQVIDITGRIVKSESINGCTNVNVNAAPGVYMLRLVNGDNVKTQKVVVK